MKVVLLFVLLLSAPHVFAGCDMVAADNTGAISIEISDGFCVYDELMIFIRKQNNENESASMDKGGQYPFAEECETLDGGINVGFSCQKGGHTILAGRTYKLQPIPIDDKRGAAEENSREPEEDSDVVRPTDWYVCVDGCTDISDFRYIHLYGDQG